MKPPEGLSATRWERLLNAFGEAIALEPLERASFANTAFPDDPDLKAEFEAMLAAHVDDIPLRVERHLAAAQDTETSHHLSPGTSIGSFRIEC